MDGVGLEMEVAGEGVGSMCLTGEGDLRRDRAWLRSPKSVGEAARVVSMAADGVLAKWLEMSARTESENSMVTQRRRGYERMGGKLDCEKGWSGKEGVDALLGSSGGRRMRCKCAVDVDFYWRPKGKGWSFSFAGFTVQTATSTHS